MITLKSEPKVAGLGMQAELLRHLAQLYLSIVQATLRPVKQVLHNTTLLYFWGNLKILLIVVPCLIRPACRTVRKRSMAYH